MEKVKRAQKGRYYLVGEGRRKEDAAIENKNEKKNKEKKNEENCRWGSRRPLEKGGSIFR